MRTFLVGGAVRDQLLGLMVKDRDWVVVGSSQQEMLAAGFTQVGRDFPVFLHPDSHEEYALARTERKSGSGYTGFDVFAAPDVTLEQDLLRRDLTINAMAIDEEGRLIDPYNGQQDIEGRMLRHVSPAFSEDPLRILRIARFAARFDHLGFEIASDTLVLMKEMVQAGELSSLVPERIWQETQRALSEPAARVYFESLRLCGALAVIFPELDRLFGIPQNIKWHPESDVAVHTFMALDVACKLDADTDTRFAVLCHDLGKGLTPSELLPAHHGHEKVSEKLANQLSKRLKVPTETRLLTAFVCRYHTHVHQIDKLKPSTVLNLLSSIDIYRKPDRFERFLLACQCDYSGRSGFQESEYGQADKARALAEAAINVDIQSILAEGYLGEQIRKQLQSARLNALTEIKKSWQQF